MAGRPAIARIQVEGSGTAVVWSAMSADLMLPSGRAYRMAVDQVTGLEIRNPVSVSV